MGHPVETWNFAWELISPIHMLYKKRGSIWELFEKLAQPNDKLSVFTQRSTWEFRGIIQCQIIFNYFCLTENLTPNHLCWENLTYLERKWWLNDDQIRSLDVTDKALKFKICSPQLPFSHDPSKNVWLFFQWILFLDNFVVIALLYVIAEQQILWVLSGISLNLLYYYFRYKSQCTQ